MKTNSHGRTSSASRTFKSLLLVVFTLSAVATSNDGEATKKPFSSIPGLYENTSYVESIQGVDQFDQLVLGTQERSEGPLRGDESSRISLVHFYMATCPDCQGFAPYFRRLAGDIGRNWSPLVRVYAINCNDDANIGVCWRENPKLVVPMLRWYSFRGLSKGGGGSARFASVAHRSFIERQRRDLISLRHATIRFISTNLVERSREDKQLAEYWTSLPMRWHQLAPLADQARRNSSLDVEGRKSALLTELTERTLRCAREANTDAEKVFTLVLLEKPQSFSGRTAAADWSRWACRPVDEFAGQLRRPFIIHHTNELELPDWTKNKSTTDKLGEATEDGAESVRLFTLDSTKNPNSLGQLQLRPLAAHGSRERRSTQIRGHTHPPVDRPWGRKQLAQLSGHRRVVRTVHQPSSKVDAERIAKQWIESENNNWTPEHLFPGEEALRFKLNKQIAELVLRDHSVGQFAGFPDGHQGEIQVIKNRPDGQVIRAVDEDLTLLRLTDYYKVLAQLVRKNILSRSHLDGFQLLSVVCFLNQLVHRYPFQGANSTSNSIARNYLQQLQRAYADELAHQLAPSPAPNCQAESAHLLATKERLRAKLASIQTSSEQLDKIQRDIERKQNIGLAAEQHFKWSYCAGSSEYLRGHTCSLWLLFHTLTVHEYLEAIAKNGVNESTNSTQEYKFFVDYQHHNSSNHRECDNKEPEPALLNAKPGELFVPAPHLASASIINFVRPFLTCTNCAAHFSCMVEHSQLNMRNPQNGDHLLWLWEAHNRVNERTRRTHSEDPIHPKHIFPAYDACPACYIERPADGAAFKDMKFNRQPLIDFIVARYRRSAILNNKIRIEELYWKPIPSNPNTTTPTPTSSSSPTPSTSTSPTTPIPTSTSTTTTTTKSPPTASPSAAANL